MAVLGIIIAVIAVAFGVGMLAGGAVTMPLQFHGLTIGGATGAGVFVAGLLTMLVLLLGLWLARGGTRRAVRRRHERHELRRRAAAMLDRDEPPKASVAAAGHATEPADLPSCGKSASGRHAKTEPEVPADDPLQPPLH